MLDVSLALYMKSIAVEVNNTILIKEWDIVEKL